MQDIGFGSRIARAPSAASGQADLGAMPEWNLADLYPGRDSPALKADIAKAAQDASALKTAYQGKLTEIGKDGAALAKAVAAYESLSDVIGKLGSYAGLLYSSDTASGENAKFYGDIQEKITAITTDLIFFELELNKIADADLADRERVVPEAVHENFLEPVPQRLLLHERAPEDELHLVAHADQLGDAVVADGGANDRSARVPRRR